MDKIEKTFGKGSIMKMGDDNVQEVEVIPTGSIALNAALGVGGYPKGRIIEIYGPESSGKTTLAIHAIAEAQKAGGIAAFIDAEHAFDRFYAAKLGVDVDNLWISQPDNGEQALEIAEQLIRSSAIDIIVIDSVAALTPKAEIEGDMGDNKVGLQARLMSLHILYLYNKITADPASFTQPVVFFFAAKASPGYVRAKNIIRLINAVADLVNNDPKTKDILKVVFIENYNVSAAEILIPATDFSEQLSTAGKEASGTGNMKFMMNGAVTIGTMDGANVEICERVGRENMFIFGATVEEINQMQRFNSYRPGEYYEKDAELRDVLNKLIDGSLPGVNERQFADLYHSLIFGDYEKADQYYLLHDFRSYINAFNRAVKAYQDPEEWYRMAAYNTVRSGIFSSDRHNPGI